MPTSGSISVLDVSQDSSGNFVVTFSLLCGSGGSATKVSSSSLTGVNKQTSSGTVTIGSLTLDLTLWSADGSPLSSGGDIRVGIKGGGIAGTFDPNGTNIMGIAPCPPTKTGTTCSGPSAGVSTSTTGKKKPKAKPAPAPEAGADDRDKVAGAGSTAVDRVEEIMNQGND